MSGLADTDAGKLLAGALAGGVALLDEIDRVPAAAITDPTMRRVLVAARDYRRRTGGMITRDVLLATVPDAGSQALAGEVFDVLTSTDAQDAAGVRWYADKVVEAHRRHTLTRVMAEASDIASGSVTEELAGGRPGRTWSGVADAAEWLRLRAAEVEALGATKQGVADGVPGGPPAPDPAMYHGLLGEIVHAAEPTTEADPVGVLVSLLAGVGVVLGPGPHVAVGNTRHPLLLWPLLFGRTGSGRKGEATGTAELFLRACDGDTRPITVTGLSSGEGLIERIRDKRGADDPGGTDDKRLLVIEPEFSSVLARAKREGSTLSAVVRQAWDGRGLSVINRDALTASGSHVGIIGHVTPKEFRRRLAEAEMSGGTYNRFLAIYVERSKRLPVPEGIDDEVRRALTVRLSAAIGEAKNLRRVRMADDARRLWVGRLYDEFSEADDEDAAWTEFARRAAPYCLRIAGLHAVLRGSVLISAADLNAAAALVRYSVASARFVLDAQTRDPRLDRVRRAVDGAGDEGLSRTQVSALFSRNLTRAQLDELLTALVADGSRYEVRTISTGGRPAQSYVRVPSSSFVPRSPDEDGDAPAHDYGLGAETDPDTLAVLAGSALAGDPA